MNTQISRYDYNDGAFRDILIDGNYAYCATAWAGTTVWNITDPYNPILSDSLDNAPVGFEAYGLAKSGNYLFVVCRTSGPTYQAGDDGILSVVDVTDPTNISEVESVVAEAKFSDISIDGNYAYVAAQTKGVWIYDISNPLSLSLVTSYDTGGYETQGIHKTGNYAYVANYYRGLSILNVSNLGAITDARVDFTDTNQELWDVFCEGNYCYGSIMRSGTYTVGSSEDTRGVVIFDVTDRTAPTILSQFLFKDYGLCSDNIGGDDPPLKIFKKGELLYVANGTSGSNGLIVVVNVSDPSNPKLFSSFQTDALDNIESIAISGNTLVTGDGTGTGTSDLVIFSTTDSGLNFNGIILNGITVS